MALTVGIAVATANGWLNAYKHTSYSNSTVWAQLHTAIPGTGANAVSAGSTTRVQITFSAAATQAKAMTGTPTSWTNGGSSETITHISLWSASSAGSLLWTSAVSPNKAWVSGDTLTLTTCGLSLSPVAA